MKLSITRILASLFITIVVGFPTIAFAQSPNQNPWGHFLKPVDADTVAWKRSYVEGFVWPTSIKPGDQLSVYVSVRVWSESQSYDMEIFRVDHPNDETVQSATHYQGQFFPLYDSSGIPIYPGDRRRPVDYKEGCRTRWQQGAISLNTGGWAPGFYYIRLTHSTLPGTHGEKEYYIPFVVRATSPGTSKVLCKVDVNTYQAYNYWAGGSFYWDYPGSSLARDSVIAFDRPLYHDWAFNFYYQYRLFVRLMDSLGYAMEFCNNIDLDKTTAGFGENLLSNYNMLVIWNHDEYWAPQERTNIERFKGNQGSNLHGNIARFAPNTCFRRVKWVGGSGDEYAKLKCVKDHYTDLRDQWRKPAPDDPVARPEAQFLAVQYQNGFNIAGDSIATEPPDSLVIDEHWIFRGTNLTTQNPLFGYGFPEGIWRRGIVSYELDNMNTGQDSVRLQLQVLARRSPISNLGSGQYGPMLHQMVFAEDTVSNSRVFASGAGNWWNGFDPRCNNPTDVQRVKTITKNIFDHFSGKKYIGKVYTGSDFPLEWGSPIELDGNVEVPVGKYLRAQSCTITVDSTFAINGTLEINGNVTIAGPGQINLGATGEIKLMPGATLTIGTKVITAANVSFNVPLNTTVRVLPGAEFRFGTQARLSVDGKLAAVGTSTNRITFTSASLTPQRGDWYAILLYGGPDTLSYCNIQYAGNGVYVGNSQSNLVDHCSITQCSGNAVLGFNSSSSYGGLMIQNSSLTNSGRGIGLSGARADVYLTTARDNSWQGLYATNSTCYMVESSLENNGYYGALITQKAGLLVLGDQYYGPGYNVIYNNNSSQSADIGEITLS
jgi:hypothetical protein